MFVGVGALLPPALERYWGRKALKRG